MAGQKTPRPAKRHLVRWTGKLSFPTFIKPVLFPTPAHVLEKAWGGGSYRYPPRRTLLVGWFQDHLITSHLCLRLGPRAIPLHLYNRVSERIFANAKTDEMDKKLLLTIQSVCNAENIKIPWDKVGAIMGERISDGAVIQHLAKLRVRMVAQNLDVPPPLRRGGGIVTPIGFSGEGSGQSKSTPTKTPRSTPKKHQSNGAASNNAEEENEYDVGQASDPEEEFGHARSNISKRGSIRGRARVKKEESEEELNTLSKVGNKRKRRSPASEMNKGKKSKSIKEENTGHTGEMAATQTKLGGRTRNAIIRYTEEEEDSSEGDDGYKSESENEDSEDDVERVQHVASGAPFLRFASESESEVKDKKSETPTKIVVLPLPGHRKHPESYPVTPEYNVHFAESAIDRNEEAEVQLEDGAGHIPAGLVTTDNPVEAEALGTDTISQYPYGQMTYNDVSGNFYHSTAPSTAAENLYGHSQTMDGYDNSFSDALDHGDMNQGFPINQDFSFPDHGYGSGSHMPDYHLGAHMDFPYPLTGRESNVSLSNPPTSTSPLFGSGSSNYMYQSQVPNSNLGTSMDPFRSPGFDARGADNYFPTPDSNFNAFGGIQGLQTYGTDAKEDVRLNPDYSFSSQPSRPSVVIRQPNQPNISNEPFSATSTNNNPTPIVASAGDAGGTLAPDFTTRDFSADYDDPFAMPMDVDALNFAWDRIYPAEPKDGDEGTT